MGKEIIRTGCHWRRCSSRYFLLFKEKRYLDIIAKLPEDTKCIILSDRGIMDSKAYLGSELFTKLLDQNNLKEDDFVILMIAEVNKNKNHKQIVSILIDLRFPMNL